MKEDIKNSLDDAIRTSLFDLSLLDPGEEKDRQAACIERLVSARLKIDDQELSEENSLADYSVKRKVSIVEIAKIASPIVGGIITCVVTGIIHNNALVKVLQFETTGSIVSAGGKAILSSALK